MYEYSLALLSTSVTYFLLRRNSLPRFVLPLLLFLLWAFHSISNGAEGLTIRPASLPRDLESIRDCRALAFTHKQSLLRSEQNFVQATAVVKGTSRCLVAVSDNNGEIFGTADYRFSEGALAINNVFVTPSGRGRGIGRALMEALEEKGRDVGVLSLEVYTSNIPAVSLYRSCGYATKGIHRVVEAISNTTGASFLVEMCKTV